VVPDGSSTKSVEPVCAKWSGDFNIGLLLETINDRKQKDPTAGRVSFDRGDGKFNDALAVLESSVGFDEAIPESMYRGLTFRSLVAVAESKTLTAKAFMDELSRQEQAYKVKAPKRYVLTTSMSARNLSDSLSRTGISDTRITFGERLPETFRVEHEQMRQRGRNVLFGDLPKFTGMMRRYTFVRVSVWAKSEIEAVESALGGLNLLRGIWNFILNYPTAWRVSAGKRNPVNKIVLGPIHSLHEPSGTLASRFLWYEPDYVGPLTSVRLDRHVDALRASEKTFRRYLTKSHYRADLEDSIRRYGRILDSRDWNNAFVQLWGLLEHLTDTTRTENRVTCRRARFLYPKEERSLHKEVLDHLAHHRNRAVHAGYVSEDAETLLYQLKRYVERVLWFHLFFGVNFSNRVEAVGFLNLPPDLDELQKRMRLMRRAMTFHE
jgi:hypothetical protein